MKKVRITKLPKAQVGPPTALEFYKQAAERKKQQLLEDGKKLKGLPGNPYTEEEAKAIKDAEMERRRKEYQLQWERDAYGRAEPTMGPIEAAIGLAASLPALATTFGTELLGTGLTVGNIVNPAFAAHGVYNFANPESDFRQAVSRYNAGEGDWRDIAFEGGLNALNFLGAKSLPGDIKNFGKAYNEVATGNSVLPFAWKSPAVGLSQGESAEMFSSLLNNSKLTPAERAIVTEYQHNSWPFTNRVPDFFNPAKQKALNDIITKYQFELPANSNVIATRRFNSNKAGTNTLGAKIEGNKISFGDRPTSFSVGVGRPGYGGAPDRLVIPSRQLKGIKNKFLLNEYVPLSQEELALFPEGNLKEFASKIGTNPNLVGERELIGTGLEFKQIGKVKNDIGGFDYIVKPANSFKGTSAAENTGNITADKWPGIFRSKIVEPVGPLTIEAQQQAALDLANARAKTFSESTFNKLKLQRFRPGQTFDVSNQEARFIDDPELPNFYNKHYAIDPDNPRTFDEWFREGHGSIGPSGRFGAKTFGDHDDLVVINKLSENTGLPSENILLDTAHESTHSRSVRLNSTQEERDIATDAWKPMVDNAQWSTGPANGFNQAAEESFAVQNELRTLLNDFDGSRIYTDADIPEIQNALQKLASTGHPYINNQVASKLDMSKLIKSLNAIGLGATVPVLINATQEKKKGGSIYNLPKAQFGPPTFLDKDQSGAPTEENDPYLHNFSTVNVPKNLSELPSYRAYTFGKGSYAPVANSDWATGATKYTSGYTRFDDKTGYIYQPDERNLQDFQSIPMEGDKEFNLRRFVLNPYEGEQLTHDIYYKKDPSGKDLTIDRENFIPKSYSKEEIMDNVFKDLYGQNLYKFKGNREAAYDATKEFMTNRVEPQYKGKYYEFMNNPDISIYDKNRISSSSKMTARDDSAQQELFQNFADALYEGKDGEYLMNLGDDERMAEINKRVYGDPKFKEKLDSYNAALQDWYVTNKHMTPDQAKKQVESNLYKDTPWAPQIGTNKISFKSGGSLPKAQNGDIISKLLGNSNDDDEEEEAYIPWWQSMNNQGSSGGSNENTSTGWETLDNAIRKNIKKIPRSEQINYAINQLKKIDPNYSPGIENLMQMTAWMENDHGSNPSAYNRNYTNSFMSLDKIALDNIYTPKGNNGYNRSQKILLDSFKKEGYPDRASLEKALRDEDPVAAVLAARAVYFMSPEALPNLGDPRAIFDYFGKNYNHYGYRKHMTDDEAYAKFLKGWNTYGAPQKKQGGAIRRVKINSLPKNWKSQ